MAETKDLQFGEIAVQMGLVTRDQVDDCLKNTPTPPKPLGQVLLERGHLTFEQLGQVLETQKKKLVEAEQRTQARSVGLFGQIALAKRYVTAVQLDECVKEQIDLVKQGQKIALGQLLIKKRYLTTERFLEVLKLQEKCILKCEECQNKYNIVGMKEGARFKCKQCGRVLLVPSTIESVSVVDSLTPHSGGATDSAFIKKALVGDVAGKTFGKYDIVKEVARGGMGIVFKARHRELNRVVALKILKEGEGADAVSIKRFHREAQTAAKLRHPNIVAIHDVGVEAGLHYLTMDFVEGEPLDVLLTQKKMRSDDAIRAVEEIARALHHAHAEGVIHRDVKPGNIMIDGAGKALVMDFGLAKSLDTSTLITRSGSSIGTPFYMAPEQVRGDLEAIEARSDVYSLGVILYEIVTGHVPFVGTTAMEVYQKILNDEPQRPSVTKPLVHPDLEIIILKCLEKDKTLRYASAGELADDIARYRTGEFIRARPPSLLQSGIKKIRRHRLFSVAAGVALLCLAVFVVLAQVRAKSRRDTIARTLEEAEKALATGRFDDAVRDFGVVEQLDPGNSKAKDGVQRAETARTEAARVAKEESDRRAAEERERKRLADLAEALAKARTHIDAGQYDEAMNELGAAQKLDPGNAEAEQGIARVRRLKKEAEKKKESSQYLDFARQALDKKEYSGARDALLKARELGAAESDVAPLMRRALGTGRLTLETKPAVDVIVVPLDEKTLAPGEPRPLGKTSLRGVDVPGGAHRLEMRIESGRLHLLPLRIPRGESGEGEAVSLALDLDIPAGIALVPEGPFTFGGAPYSTVVAVPQNPREERRTGAFLMDITEVTNASYKKFLDTLQNAIQRHMYRPDSWTEDGIPPGEENYPVRGISLDAARAYAISIGARLPTETEWEKAARGTDGRIYPWGNDATFVTTLSRPLGDDGGLLLDTSPYGVRALSAGVAEWTWDPSRVGRNSRAVRGGFWEAGTVDDGYLYYRADFDGKHLPKVIGLRCVRSRLTTTDPQKLIELCAHEDFGVRMAAITALADVKGAAAQAAIVKALSDSIDDVAWAALFALRKRGVAKPFSLLDGERHPVRARAAGWLLLYGDPSGRDFLLLVARGTGDLVLQNELCWALINGGDEAGLVLLYQLMGENLTSEALAKENDHRLIQVRDAFGGAAWDLKMLDHKEPAVRRFAVVVLAMRPCEKAFPRLLEMKKRDPSPVVKDEAARALDYLGDPEVQIEKLTAKLQKDPENSVFLVERSIAYRRLGEGEKAIADCTRAIDANGASEQAFYHRGVLFAAKREHEKAVSDFDQAIRLVPHYGQAYASRGLAKMALNRPREAAADFRKFLEVGIQKPWFCPDEVEEAAIRKALREAERK